MQKVTKSQVRKIIRYADKGWKSKQIMTKVPVEKMQIAGVLAHLTRGTYGFKY